MMLIFSYKYICNVIEKYLNYMLRKAIVFVEIELDLIPLIRSGQLVLAGFSIRGVEPGIIFLFLQRAMVG